MLLVCLLFGYVVPNKGNWEPKAEVFYEDLQSRPGLEGYVPLLEDTYFPVKQNVLAICYTRNQVEPLGFCWCC